MWAVRRQRANLSHFTLPSCYLLLTRLELQQPSGTKYFVRMTRFIGKVFCMNCQLLLGWIERKKCEEGWGAGSWQTRQWRVICRLSWWKTKNVKVDCLEVVSVNGRIIAWRSVMEIHGLSSSVTEWREMIVYCNTVWTCGLHIRQCF